MIFETNQQKIDILPNLIFADDWREKFLANSWLAGKMLSRELSYLSIENIGKTWFSTNYFYAKLRQLQQDTKQNKNETDEIIKSHDRDIM